MKIEVEISDNSIYFETEAEFNVWWKENFKGCVELNSYPDKFPCFGEPTGNEKEVDYHNGTVYYQIYNWLYPFVQTENEIPLTHDVIYNKV